MSTLQKAIMGIIGVAAVTTALLPGRQTVPVIGAVRQLSTGTLSTAMGTSSGVK
jgi:hypothetical protein